MGMSSCAHCIWGVVKVDPQAVQSKTELFKKLTTTKEADEKVLRTKLPEGYKWVIGRPTKIQKTARPGR